MNDPPKPYSKEYFQFWMNQLQTQIQKSLPTCNINQDVIDTFTNACEAVVDTKQALQHAQDVLQKLNNKQKGVIDDATIKAAQDSYSAAFKVEIETLDLAVRIADQLILNNNNNSNNNSESFQQALLKLEHLLLPCTILCQATPAGLAKFCAQGPRQCELIDTLLASPALIKDMIAHGGAANGKYGTAMEIWTQLLLSTKLPNLDDNNNNKSSMEYKLSMAAALELADPISEFSTPNIFVDPVARVLYYLDAFHNNELDEVFENFTPWQLRYVVDCDAPNDQISWGRSYLKAYRPDEVLTNNVQWKYSMAVKTDVHYKHPEWTSVPHTYQQLISGGGECGPRAWFGRFICKAFGIPTWGVRQPGHAAMSRWTTTGDWQICLGAAWKWSWFDDRRYGSSTGRKGLDFVQETQARTFATMTMCDNDDNNNNNNDYYYYYYEQVSLLECLAECMNERVDDTLRPDKLWRSLALARRYILASKYQNVNDSKSNVVVDNEFNAINSTVHYDAIDGDDDNNVDNNNIDDNDDDDFSFCHDNNEESTEIAVETNTDDCPISTRISFMSSNIIPNKTTSTTFTGSIVIPADGFTNKPNGNVRTMSSFLNGGKQIHLEKSGTVEYTLPAVIPMATYHLTCRLVNVHKEQKPLLLSIENNNDDGSVDLYTIPVPYTVGDWQTTTPIPVQVGSNSKLHFTREPPCNGLSIKDFELIPI